MLLYITTYYVTDKNLRLVPKGSMTVTLTRKDMHEFSCEFLKLNGNRFRL